MAFQTIYTQFSRTGKVGGVSPRSTVHHQPHHPQINQLPVPNGSGVVSRKVSFVPGSPVLVRAAMDRGGGGHDNPGLVIGDEEAPPATEERGVRRIAKHFLSKHRRSKVKIIQMEKGQVSQCAMCLLNSVKTAG